jgi:hypothetical protein
MTTRVTTNSVVFNDGSTQNTASDYRSTTYTANSTYTKPDNLKAIRVTIVGGGGSGGPANGSTTTQGKSSVTYNSRGGSGGGGGTVVAWVDAASVPGSPVAVTVGGVSGTSSFGTLASATGGTTGTTAGSNQNLAGAAGGTATLTPSPTVSGIAVDGQNGGNTSFLGQGGNSLMGSGGIGGKFGDGDIIGGSGHGFGAGAAGGVAYGPGTQPGGTGTVGIVIVEEFF